MLKLLKNLLLRDKVRTLASERSVFVRIISYILENKSFNMSWNSSKLDDPEDLWKKIEELGGKTILKSTFKISKW